MAFNGSGGTTQPVSSIYPAVASTLIQSAKFNISIADIYTMLAGVICKDGQTTTTLRIPFAAGISTDTITEKTVGVGVTVGGALLTSGRIDTTQGADIASAATINLETATGNLVDVTGTTTVTAITLSQGHFRIVRFTGALTLTNGASLVLPGAANIVTAAGDFGLFVGYASSVVRCAFYKRASGQDIVTSQTLTDAATINWNADSGIVASVTLGGNRTMAAPTNLKVGTYILHVIQDGTGSRTMTWNAVFKWQGGTAPTLSTGVTKRDIFSFVSDGTTLYGSVILDVR
jgi:hypothetical protein